MKIHLGCGERYLNGYVNIDFPPEQHSVQTNTRVDQYADIMSLQYEAESLDEIRLHHVFEHFTRPVALALLSAWYMWLKPNGTLHIEVPDVQRTILSFILPFGSFRKKMVAIRHVFGSHEAPWAVHCEGYSAASLRRILKTYGFSDAKISRNSWRGIHNVEIIVKKTESGLSLNALHARTEKLLKNYMVDQGPTEQRLYSVWVKSYEEQLKKLIPA